LAIIAYGKLGGKELGYGSDLDLVFLYEANEADDAPEAGPDSAGPVEAYLLFARKLITWLTLHTPSGELFDIDMALRPNGNSGLLVTSVQAFDNYQRQRGDNTAWTWEHQALSRARWCAGDARLLRDFEATRRAVLATQRPAADLRQEIQSMRERLRQAHSTPPDTFDLKHGSGGMVDIEFAVQYLVLAHSHDHPALMDNVGNIALLGLAALAGLLPTGVSERASDAYRVFRRLQHRARLDESPTVLAGQARQEQGAHIEAGQLLWQQVFPH
jgi:glutamate-ammonia-ligase adenylyltransferase